MKNFVQKRIYLTSWFVMAAACALTWVARAQTDSNATVDMELRFSATYADVGEVRANIPAAEIDEVLRTFFNRTGPGAESGRRRLVELVSRYIGVTASTETMAVVVQAGLIQNLLQPGRVGVRERDGGYEFSSTGMRPSFAWFYRGTAGENGRFPLAAREELRPALSPGVPVPPELMPFATFLVNRCQYRLSPAGEAWRGRDGNSWLVSFGAEAEARDCDGFLQRAPTSLHQFLPGADAETVALLLEPLARHGIYRPQFLEHLRSLSVKVVMQARP